MHVQKHKDGELTLQKGMQKAVKVALKSTLDSARAKLVDVRIKLACLVDCQIEETRLVNLINNLGLALTEYEDSNVTSKQKGEIRNA
jgi:hypothetical protein